MRIARALQITRCRVSWGGFNSPVPCTTLFRGIFTTIWATSSFIYHQIPLCRHNAFIQFKVVKQRRQLVRFDRIGSALAFHRSHDQSNLMGRTEPLEPFNEPNFVQDLDEAAVKAFNNSQFLQYDRLLV